MIDLLVLLVGSMGPADPTAPPVTNGQKKVAILIIAVIIAVLVVTFLTRKSD